MLLKQQELAEIHDVALQLEFGERRKALMSGIDSALVQGIQSGGRPSDQLWLDISYLSLWPKTSDIIDEHPLACWLFNAERLAQPYPEASIFKHYLEKLRGNLSGRIKVGEGSSSGSKSFARRFILPKPFFVGRKKELLQLREALLPETGWPKPVAILGQGGLGKTWLAEHFAGRHQEGFPGGRHRLILNVKDQRSSAQCLAELNQELKLGAPPDRHVHEVAKALREPKALLHIDNADTPELAAMVAELVRDLPGVAVLLTGRYTRLGEDRNAGWLRILPELLSPEDAREQVKEELVGCNRLPLDKEIDRLVKALGYLPLAIHLAAGHLRAGRSVDSFLRLLQEKRYQIKAIDTTAVRAEEIQRQELGASFSLSFEAFQEQVGPRAERLAPALRNLGWAPLAGFGQSLGMAITGLDELDFEELMIQARGLSLLDEVPMEEREDPAWVLHPLMAGWLGLEGDKQEVQRRMGLWILERIPQNPQDSRGQRWEELTREAKGVRAWLEEGPFEILEEQWGWLWYYASSAGGVEGWMEAVEKTLSQVKDARKRSALLWSLGQMARYSGRLDKAWEAVEQQIQIDRAQGWEGELAWDQSLQADIWVEQGRLDEALGLLREQVLPAYKRLEEKQGQSVALSKIAEILRQQGQLEEALRIWREEALPLLEEVGDERDLAVGMANMAVILQQQGKVDEAIAILRKEVLPVFERLGDRLELITSRANLADDLLKRGLPEDRPEAQDLLTQALAEAERMKLSSKIAWIRRIQQYFKLPVEPAPKGSKP